MEVGEEKEIESQRLKKNSLKEGLLQFFWLKSDVGILVVDIWIWVSLELGINHQHCILLQQHGFQLRWIGEAGHININGIKYQLNQIHWHTATEHTIKDKGSVWNTLFSQVMSLSANCSHDVWILTRAWCPGAIGLRPSWKRHFSSRACDNVEVWNHNRYRGGVFIGQAYEQYERFTGLIGKDSGPLELLCETPLFRKLTDLPEIDGIFITQSVDDHCHLKTLKPLSQKLPNVRATAGPILGPPWQQPENGYIAASPQGQLTLYYEPHCVYDQEIIGKECAY
ncbi:metallo-hydrolase/oxidoreductase superfamily protein [Artemisia annua]|uniref:Metallo-hydrolase/oxidoreductase superfamily protein n=1 Tax=Artemisia annua TaxID=35608 RepID=A0A2U1LTT1_ARTAN|nr:metallo-hydrolase/oxidoreductase superfamily protein [Artemisia annua]